MDSAVHVQNVSADFYNADKFRDEPTLSSGIAKLICNESPLHAWTAHPKLNPHYKPEDTKERDFGTILHALLLQGENRAHIIQATNDRGEPVTDYRTASATQERQAARLARYVPILKCDWQRVEPMLVACRRQLAIHKDAKNAFTNGAPEQTLLWREDNGVWCRARLDWLHADLSYFDDYKSRNGSANPDQLERTMLAEGWDIQEAFYRRGIEKVFPEARNPIGRFIAQETSEPYALAVVTPGPDVRMMADKRVQQAIEMFGECLRTGCWPGYDTKTRVTSLPVWMEKQLIEKELRGVGL